MKQNQDRWTAFFYLLLRDSLPVGEVLAIVEELKEDKFELCNDNIANLAKDIISRLNKQGNDEDQVIVAIE